MDLPVCTRHRQEVTGCAGVLRQTVGRTSLQEPPMSLDAAAYQRLYAQSVDDPDAFWGEAARRLDWMRAPTRVKYTSFDADDFHIRWYEDGELNASVECLDRHLARRGDKTAIVFEPDDPNGESQRISYRDLHARVCRLANALRNLGIGKGDRVTIYLPMIPEADRKSTRLNSSH